MNELIEVSKKILSHKSVIGVLVLNREGYRVHQAWSSASSEVSEAQSDSYWQLARRLYHTAAESLYAHDAQDRVALLTLRTSKLDLIFAPEREYCLVTIQHAQTSDTTSTKD
eukprot:TRINITY_DN12024_c0_g1_i1.p1 TRINITY_DN12024_c0_g1~~TRINITY_DN12024_c0_g1_i1.p1  ORF type:complete len:112 (-),score=39.87 TRINITY_DN12024_c0_g1_i1:113-448(-)